MPRLPLITSRDDVPESARETYDLLTARSGQLVGPIQTLMHVPEIALRTARLATPFRFRATLSPRDRELAIISAARAMDCDYEWAAHVPAAIEAGVTQQAVDAVSAGSSLDGFGADEAAIIKFARELLNDHHISDGTWRDVHDRLGDGRTVELAALIGYYLMIACTLLANAVEPPEGGARMARPSKPA